MGGVICSQQMKEYFASLETEAKKCYDIASKARKKGLDPELEVEIPRVEDLASRVERLLEHYGVKGIAKRIRKLSKTNNREEVSLLIAKEMARRARVPKEQALERAIRVGLAILTEGILVAPLEGLATVKVEKNPDGTTYADVYYAGPIRSAGGTGQALSVLIADVVRRELGIGIYKPTREEVERFKEEIPLYNRSHHLQYMPTDEEIELIVGNCPVSINGEGTETVEITGHRDLPRVETNRVRGGACLVLAEGLCLKAPKIKKHVGKLSINGWEFIDQYLHLRKSDEVEAQSIGPNYQYIQNILAGRPVLSHPSRKGGFRLRYGRTRATGLAALAIHPATMRVLDEFIAVGTQIKTERPGKAAAITPCDSIEGPLVLLDDGSFVAINDEMNVPKGRIREIVDLGEILIPFGEFLENNHLLLPGSYSLEWYLESLRRKTGKLPEDWENPTVERAFEISEQFGVPLHPNYNLFWHDISADELRSLRDHILSKGQLREGKLVVERNEEVKSILLSLGAIHHEEEESFMIDFPAACLLRCLGIQNGEGGLRKLLGEAEGSDPLEIVSRLAGVKVMPRAPTRIGARMGRPEKAKERLMRPAPHVLFPLGIEGGTQRLVSEAASKGAISVEVGLRICEKCGKRWFLPRCTCGGRTRAAGAVKKQRIPLDEIYENSLAHLNERNLSVKGVRGMISKDKTPEMLEKGILRAKYNINVFKDGTTRFDMTDVPLTHFKPSEIGIDVVTAKELGYETDWKGRPLQSPDQLLELKPQDFIASSSCGDYLLRVSKFVDSLLARVYGMKEFYNAEGKEDLIGHLIVGLAPHTSSGLLGRLIGYTDARVGYAHPYFHAGKRRNCDGDEDCVMLLLDGLINFSRAFLPEKRGGLMDAPLVLTTRLDPDEIDREAHNIDLNERYPLELYEAASMYEHPKVLEGKIDLVGDRIGTPLQYEELAFTHKTSNIAAGPLKSSYKAGSMISKMEGQLNLAKKIRAVDVDDVVSRIITHHFLPDLIGNLKAFSTQQVRCTSCNAKYRRIPLKGKCPKCNGNLTLTVHENSVKKYLEVCMRIAEEYGVSQYLRQRVDLIEGAIHSLFTNEKVQHLKLDDFC